MDLSKTVRSNEIMIRPEEPVDVAGIVKVHAESFATAAEARLVDRLRSAGKLLVSLVAEKDGVIVGHVAFSPVTAPNSSDGLGLGPIAVLKPNRRRGIAAGLIREGLDVGRRLGFGWAVVLGEPCYYQRFGFKPSSLHGLWDEFGGGDAFQFLEIIQGHTPISGGLVRYSHVFDALDE